MNNETEAINRIVELGVAAAKPEVQTNGDKAFAFLPSDTKAHDLSAFFPPTHIARAVEVLDAGSFADYVNRYKTDRTLLFAKVSDSGAVLKAILDYHGAAPELKAERCEHTAIYSTADTSEWKTWMAANRKPMNQVEFATWLEDNLPLFVEPKGADLLELVKTLVGKSDVRFTSSLRLDSGANQLHYDEDVSLKGQTTTKPGDIELPNIITAGIAPFQGAAKYEVKARLKYRIENRKLSLWFETIGVHTIIRDSVLEVVKEIEGKTGIKPLLGTT